MRVEFSMDLPIQVKPIDDHYGLEVKEYDVADIEMGQSSTRIKLYNISTRFNSIHFNFYLYDKEIDIYSSGLINRYRWKYLPMICFK